MPLQVYRSNQFRRDYKRALKGQRKQVLVRALGLVLEKLVMEEKLPAKYRDHQLTGNWRGYRECHIFPDVLLVYRIVDNDELQLARLGSHSEVFN